MRYLLYLLFAVCLPFASFAEDNLSKAPDVSNLEELTVENLERAAALWQVEDVEKLQQKGFDFNQKDGAGNTLLYDVLSQNQNDGVAEKLIEYGADVNPVDEQRNDRHYAADGREAYQQEVELFVSFILNIGRHWFTACVTDLWIMTFD